jgi:hypothetical protein
MWMKLKLRSQAPIYSEVELAVQQHGQMCLLIPEWNQLIPSLREKYFFSNAMAEQFARQLRETLATIATALQLSPSLYPCENLKAGSVEEFGPPEDRELAICRNIERYIDYITATDGSVTKDLRFIVIDFVPRFLLAYQALRFQPISGEDTASMPTKDTLAEFPAIVVDTGLYMPVSKLLRLVAVSLIDGESKQRLVDSGNSKALMSHMVDDPLNPLQRECAVFAVNVLTRDFEPAQRVISEIMSNR